MKKLAVCIMTYNRSEIIEEFLDMCLDMYQSYGIDIYICDSSEDDKTKKIVDSYQLNCAHLYYKHIDSSTHSNMKVYMIFQEFQKNNLYEYIWICADALRWVEESIKEIYLALEKKYDLVIVNHHDVEKIGTREYTDANELFLDCAWHMTLYGATIVRVETFLKRVNWEKMLEKYMVPERINFSHTAMYFEQLCLMKDFRALYLCIPEKNMITSEKKKFSGWHKDTFLVWCTYWPNAIMSLPDFYKNKVKVIKKNGKNSEILSLRNIYRLRSCGVYNFRIFVTYLFKWHNLVDINFIRMFKIALTSKKRAAYVYEVKLFEEEMKPLKKQIVKFCKKYEHIYIYGCGRKAQRYATYLDNLQIEYRGFLVSNLNLVKNRIVRNHEVMQFSDSLLNQKKVGILMGINEENYREVINQFAVIEKSANVFRDA